MNKIYHGENKGVGGQTISVIVSSGKNYPLKHICRHSPDGFQWGYGGSGPSDTALSILHDCMGERDANDFYMDFKWDFISGTGDVLDIKEKDIRTWLGKKKDERTLAVFQVANCVGCPLSNLETIGIGKPCCTRAEGIETDKSGKKCLVRPEPQEPRRDDG